MLKKIIKLLGLGRPDPKQIKEFELFLLNNPGKSLFALLLAFFIVTIPIAMALI